MANIPVPERGQPLDLAYIYQLANAVNQLSLQASYSANKFVSIESPGSNISRQDIKITDSRMVGGFHQLLAQNSNVTAGSSVDFAYDFPGADFRYPPIVTATPVNISGTEAGSDVTIILKLITTARVEGVVKFGTSGTASIGINLIALGVPN
jgi:hypothetical protein